jgi:hypothetical protein
MPSILYRAQEFLADHFKSVQYPRPVAVPVREPRTMFKHQMPFGVRLGLFAGGLAIVLFAAVLLVLAGVILYAVIF